MDEFTKSSKWCLFYKDNVWIISLCYETGALKSKQPRIFDVIKTLMKAKQQYVLSCTLQRRMIHRYSISKNCQQDANVYGSLWDKMSKSSQGLKYYIFLWQADGNVRWRTCYTKVAQRRKLLHLGSHSIWLHIRNVFEVEKNSHFWPVIKII